jgi:hypothetical protein
MQATVPHSRSKLLVLGGYYVEVGGEDDATPYLACRF